MHNTLGDIKDLLRRAHKRGTSLDADLDGAIRRAASWIEKNYTLQYMRRRFEIELTSGDQEVSVPDVNIKAFLSPIHWNALGTDGRYLVATKVNFDEGSEPQSYRTYSSVPQGFYLDGLEKIVFTSNYSGAELLIGTGFIARYSDFPLEDDESHWLFDFAESALLTQSMLELGVISTRDERTYAMYLKHREDQMRVMLNADFETQFSGQDIRI